MADVGKQMMFNLVIQPANHPGKNPAFGGKIAGGIELMRRPVVVKLAVFVGHGIF